jgi:hypothetical protein
MDRGLHFFMSKTGWSHSFSLRLIPLLLSCTSCREMLDETGAFIQDAGVRDAIVRSGAVKFCKKCDAYKPPRSYHCGSCGKCVARMDHHCPWVNNCVGGGNLKYFLLFLFYSTVSCIHYSALIFFFLMNFFRGRTPLQGNQLGAFLGIIRKLGVIRNNFLGLGSRGLGS